MTVISIFFSVEDREAEQGRLCGSEAKTVASGRAGNGWFSSIKHFNKIFSDVYREVGQ